MSPCRSAKARSIAGSVAPIAAVAGRSTMKVAQNATVHCQTGAGCVPVMPRTQSPKGAMSISRTTLHPAIAASQAAYQRAGRVLRSMAGPSSEAPAARPPKNAATTARTAADSWPSQSAHCCVQTIW